MSNVTMPMVVTMFFVIVLITIIIFVIVLMFIMNMIFVAFVIMLALVAFHNARFYEWLGVLDAIRTSPHSVIHFTVSGKKCATPSRTPAL